MLLASIVSRPECLSLFAQPVRRAAICEQRAPLLQYCLHQLERIALEYLSSRLRRIRHHVACFWSCFALPSSIVASVVLQLNLIAHHILPHILSSSRTTLIWTFIYALLIRNLPNSSPQNHPRYQPHFPTAYSSMKARPCRQVTIPFSHASSRPMSFLHSDSALAHFSLDRTNNARKSLSIHEWMSAH